MNMNFNFNNLIGYYFKDEYFSEVEFISPTIGGKLDFDKIGLPDICLNKKIKSARWIGFIKPALSGEYTIFTDVSNCIVQIDEKMLVSSSLYPITIRLEANKEYKIRIEQQLSEEESARDYKGAALLWKSESISDEVVPTECLINPDYSDVNEENEFIPSDNFFFTKKRTMAIDDTRDSDRDGIPDSFEIEGYTVVNLIVTKWDDELAKQGYKKYVSNPYKARTANDPFTDFEKVSGRIDPSISFIARDPMIAAYPIIGVQMENLVVSKNSTITNEAGKSMSKATSNSSTYSNTVGASISASLDINIIPTFSMSASASYSHTWENTSTITDTAGQSFTNGLSINTGESAYINPNIRYYNSGTAPVYNVSPNTTIVVNNESIATIQPNANQIGSYLNPDNFYPHQGLAPLALNTMDQFSSRLIPINYNQLKSIDNGGVVKLSTSQFTGEFAKIDINGNLITRGNDWGPYLGTIESTTASITLDMHGMVKQVRIVAKNQNDPTDATPIITLKDALKKSFNIEEINGKFYYEGVQLPNGSIVKVYIDKNTERDFTSQLQNIGGKNYLNCIIKRGTNILIRVETKLNSRVSLIYCANFERRYENAYDIVGLYNENGLPITNKFSYTAKNLAAGKYLLRLTVQCNIPFTTKSNFNSNGWISKTQGGGYYILEFYNTLETFSAAVNIVYQFEFARKYGAFIQVSELIYLG